MQICSQSNTRIFGSLTAISCVSLITTLIRKLSTMLLKLSVGTGGELGAKLVIVVIVEGIDVNVDNVNTVPGGTLSSTCRDDVDTNFR